jgi:hypothetical protein
MTFAFVQKKYFIPMLIPQQSTPDDFVRDGCAVWLGFCTVRYMLKTLVHFPALQGKDISHM